MFLSLHVKFIWFQVVLFLDIGPRHLWELLLSILFQLVHFYLKLLKISEFFGKRIMSRRMYQGGSSVKKGPRIAIREQDVELPRDAKV